MPHIIILGKNRDLAKRVADANIELAESHEVMESLPAGGSKRLEIEAMFADLETMTEGFKNAYAAAVDEIIAATS